VVFQSCGNIYKGLAQTGAWGCFDEFNRISVEVLSVVAVQVKTVQDAIRARKTKFNFLGENIALVPTVGMFITMNPGYAGRTELPENLKVLFRYEKCRFKNEKSIGCKGDWVQKPPMCTHEKRLCSFTNILNSGKWRYQVLPSSAI